MKPSRSLGLLGAGLLLVGCATNRHPARGPSGLHTAGAAPPGLVRGLPAEVQARILELDPEQVSARDVRSVLARAPAPRIIAIHGGIFPIKSGMNSFARFLVGMGYPEASLRNAGDNSYTYGYYDRSDRLAGTVAWYYERDGLRPILVGHSQGGIQAVRVLHKLAGDAATRLAVWNPLTGKQEKRWEIIDPLTGRSRPVVGLQVAFATAAVAGGLARALPNEWDMNTRLRHIPDSVVEFTGFQKGLDPLGGDFLGYGPANEYRPTGNARVRNVRLPASSPHSTIPYTQGLLRRPEVREWIDRYRPNQSGNGTSGPDPDPEWMNARVLWAAEVWYSIKKHWVLELQRLIRGQRGASHQPAARSRRGDEADAIAWPWLPPPDVGGYGAGAAERVRPDEAASHDL